MTDVAQVVDEVESKGLPTDQNHTIPSDSYMTEIWNPCKIEGASSLY